MSKDKWNNGKTNRFISSYIKEESLWNVSHPEYASKQKKEIAYKNLQEEFNLSLNEVKNKIRIYRTTYGQELKKMENNNGALPRLTWFNELHKAFNKGKIKSFTKSPAKRVKTEKVESAVEKMYEIEYQDDSLEEDAETEKVEKLFDSKKAEKTLEPENHQIIIEPYEEEYDEVEYQDEQAGSNSMVKRFSSATALNGTNTNSPSVPAQVFSATGIGSNELFLKSLQATLDKLPDEKNMRARIKIQEVLYKIAYEVDK